MDATGASVEITGALAAAIGSDEIEGNEKTFLVVLFGAGGGADGRLAILGMPVDDTTSVVLILGSGAGAGVAVLLAGVLTTAFGAGGALLAALAVVFLTKGAFFAAGAGALLTGTFLAGAFLATGGGAFLAGAGAVFRAGVTEGFWVAEDAFFTGGLALAGVFFGTGFGVAFFRDGWDDLAVVFLETAVFLVDWVAVLAVLTFGLDGLLLLTGLAPLVVKCQPPFAFDTCDAHGFGVGRGAGITEPECQWNIVPIT